MCLWCVTSNWSVMAIWFCVVVRVPVYISRGPGFDSRRYHILWEVVGLERGPLSLVSITEELLERKCSGSGLENREYGRWDPFRWPRDTLYPQKLALTSPTSSVRSVGIVGLRTKVTEFVVYFCWIIKDLNMGMWSSFFEVLSWSSLGDSEERWRDLTQDIRSRFSRIALKCRSETLTALSAIIDWSIKITLQEQKTCCTALPSILLGLSFVCSLWACRNSHSDIASQRNVGPSRVAAVDKWGCNAGKIWLRY
jgi:hypothetical protein